MKKTLKNAIQRTHEAVQTELMLAINNNNYFFIDKKINSIEFTQQLSTSDHQGNTLLHYAVAARNLSLIIKLIKLGIDVDKKNHRGETAAEWFFPYYYHLNYSKIYDQVPENIFSGNIDFLIEHLENNVSRQLRYYNGNTPLHLAVIAGRLEIIKLLLNIEDMDTLKKMLESRDCQGKTAFEMLTTLENHEKIIPEIQKFFEEKQTKVQNIDLSSTNFTPLLSESLKEKTGKLNQWLTNKNSLRFDNSTPETQDHLQTLCYLSIIVCQQALLLLNEFNTNQPSVNYEKKEIIKKIFLNLWGDNGLKESTEKRIRSNIFKILDYFEKAVTINSNFSDKLAWGQTLPYLGWSSRYMNKIFLNPTEKTMPANLVRVLIHEVAHIATGHHDFAYTTCNSASENSIILNIDACYQLANKGIYNNILTEEGHTIIAIQNLLENSELKSNILFPWEQQNPDYQLSKNNYGISLYSNNDTLVTTIFSLAATRNNALTINNENQLIIDKNFLSIEFLPSCYTKEAMNDLLNLTRVKKAIRRKIATLDNNIIATVSENIKKFELSLNRDNDLFNKSIPHAYKKLKFKYLEETNKNILSLDFGDYLISEVKKPSKIEPFHSFKKLDFNQENILISTLNNNSKITISLLNIAGKFSFEQQEELLNHTDADNSILIYLSFLSKNYDVSQKLSQFVTRLDLCSIMNHKQQRTISDLTNLFDKKSTYTNVHFVLIINNIKKIISQADQKTINFNKKDEKENKLLPFSATKNNENQNNILISVFNININQPENERKTRLIIAKKSNNIPIIKILLQHTKIDVKGNIACNIYLKGNFKKSATDYSLSQDQEIYHLFKYFVKEVLHLPFDHVTDDLESGRENEEILPAKRPCPNENSQATINLYIQNVSNPMQDVSNQLWKPTDTAAHLLPPYLLSDNRDCYL